MHKSLTAISCNNFTCVRAACAWPWTYGGQLKTWKHGNGNGNGNNQKMWQTWFSHWVVYIKNTAGILRMHKSLTAISCNIFTCVCAACAWPWTQQYKGQLENTEMWERKRERKYPNDVANLSQSQIIPGRHSRFVIVRLQVVVYWLTDNSQYSHRPNSHATHDSLGCETKQLGRRPCYYNNFTCLETYKTYTCCCIARASGKHGNMGMETGKGMPKTLFIVARHSECGYTRLSHSSCLSRT